MYSTSAINALKWLIADYLDPDSVTNIHHKQWNHDLPRSRVLEDLKKKKTLPDSLSMWVQIGCLSELK